MKSYTKKMDGFVMHINVISNGDGTSHMKLRIVADNKQPMLEADITHVDLRDGERIPTVGEEKGGDA